jgi:hypothetical protein
MKAVHDACAIIVHIFVVTLIELPVEYPISPVIATASYYGAAG